MTAEAELVKETLMAFRELMVRRMDPHHTDRVAQLFAEHDASGFPEEIGATRRTLFQFNDLYLHLIEADEDIMPALLQARENPLFRNLDEELAPLLLPYAAGPPSMIGSRSRMFYSWSDQ